MRRPRLDRSSAAGNSLVGTLLALGLLLAMVTGGIALMVSTEGRTEPVAEIRLGPIAFEPCPAMVTQASADATTLRCAGVPVLNTGQAQGLARCMLFDGARGSATFDTNGTHVGSIEVAPGTTEELLVRIEGEQNPTLPVAECSSVPLLAG
jgi:hypothetical protein